MKRPASPRATALSTAIRETLAWFDLFGQPVPFDELHRHLFDVKVTPAELTRTLKKDTHVATSFGNYFLKNGDTVPLARIARSYRAEQLWRRVRRYRFLFRLTPFLRFVAVGNTLAFGWPSETSDIDLFVVADTRRLFTARLILTGLTHLFGVRRHADKVTGRFCLSFFAADDALELATLSIKPRDPYLAFWVATLVPVWGEDARLVARANTWIRDYFPNLPWPKLRMAVDPKRSILRRIAEYTLGGALGDVFEAAAKRWQLARARKKYTPKVDPTAVIIAEKTLKFHEKDRRREYADAWKKRCKEMAK